MTLTRTIAESFTAFCDQFRIPLFAHQREDFGAALERAGGRFVNRLAAVSWPRGDGKSWAVSAAGVWRLVAGPRKQHVLSVALDLDGADVVMEHARTIIRSNSDLERAIEIRVNSFLVPATGSRWTVSSREHTSSRGEHPDVVTYDETGWARDDELFASLMAGQASVPDPLMLIASTVGRRKSGPLWRVKALAEAGAPGVCWRWSGENRSPKVTTAFLDRQRHILLPGQFAREHQNQWIEGADAFSTAADIDAAMAHGWIERADGEPDTVYEHFWDLGAVHDPTVGAVGHRAGAMAVIDKLVTFQGSREQPVQLAGVEGAIRELHQRFPGRVRVESWQGMAAVQSLQRLGLPVELFTPTAKAHAEEWPVLAQRLSTKTLVLPNHGRLREELLNLVYEVGPTGVRVIDRGQVHQDHAVAVRGVIAALDRVRPVPFRLWGAGEHFGDPAVAAVLAEHQEAARQVSAETIEDTVRRGGGWFPHD